jgi:hypothetical protein
MGIDETRQYNMARRIKHRVRFGRWLPACAYQLNNPASLQQKSAASPITQNSQWIFEPDALHFTFPLFLG